MQKAFWNFEWRNEPSDETPLDRDNLMRINNGVDEIDDRVIALDTEKFDKTEAQGLFKDVSFNRDNGVITFILYNGSVKTIDTLLEKMAVNFDFDPKTQRLIIILDDGTEKYVDLSAFITQHEFLDSETIAWVLGDNGEVSAKVREGSIEEKHLRPDYLADIRVETARAEASRKAAEESARTASICAFNARQSEKVAKDAEKAAERASTAAVDSEEKSRESAKAAEESARTASICAFNARKSETAAADSEEKSEGAAKTASDMADMAKSYAVGTEGSIREGDETDNARNYSEKAQKYYEQTKQASDAVNGAIDSINKEVPRFVVNFEDGQLYHTPCRFAFLVNRSTGNLDWGLRV